MKHGFTISLQNRLTLTYTLFISAALAVLALAINLFTNITFTALVKENIIVKSGEIVRAISELYNPILRSFDSRAVENLAMYFVHEGYIVSVEDGQGEIIWDARSCDMQQCRDVINDISSRMEGQFRVNGGMREQSYPVQYNGKDVGAVIIESYGPFFYNETETNFLHSINKLLFIAGVLLCMLGAAISIALARGIARPVNQAGAAAREIAQIHSSGAILEHEAVKIPDKYKTRELAELSGSINRLAEKLAEAERGQKQLTADIAHELRTPLTCLRGNIEAMIDGVFEPDNEHLQSCYEEIIRLTNLVEDLTTLSCFELESAAYGMSKNLNKSFFDIAKLLQTTAEQFEAAAAEKGVILRLNLRESPINACYDRIKQVFINLLSNAIKYTDCGSISVSIEEVDKEKRLDAPPGVRWEITIADTGIGIPECDIPHIFERFYRTDKSRNRSTGGAGIGLTIAAAIVNAHGGIINVESSGGAENGGGSRSGSIFRVLL
ncbi:MAG: HAMP domain-containing protein [Spirochaetaceae bacterium]|jgi:signal transduction histidine kinase|nr:HAMP domain-containing protein [Spirochaetaceae bacterium]